MTGVFTTKDPAEVIVLAMDFTLLMNSGETITAASWTIARSDGYSGDTTCATSGAIDISGQPVIRQKITGGINGSGYTHTVQATTNQDRVLVASASQQVVTGGA